MAMFYEFGIMRLKLLLCLLMVGLSSCLRERSYRVRGAYLAPKSGYRLDLILQGIWDPDSETVKESYKRAQICPLKLNQGRSIRFILDSERDRWVVFFQKESVGSPVQEWDFRSSPIILRQTLSQSGFSSIDSTENAQMAEILSSGFGARADLKAITVIKEESNDNYPFNRAKLHFQWIQPSELPPCSPK
jgi:hypothetical protein